MHYLGSLAWLFDLRYWRLLPLECRSCSEGSLRLGRGQGWMGFSLLGQFGHIFERLSQISTWKAQLPLECDSTKPIPLPKSLVQLGKKKPNQKNPEKIKRGVNFTLQLGENCDSFFCAFPPIYPVTLSKNIPAWTKILPSASMRFIHVCVNTFWMQQKADFQGLVWLSGLGRCHLS